MYIKELANFLLFQQMELEPGGSQYASMADAHLSKIKKIKKSITRRGTGKEKENYKKQTRNKTQITLYRTILWLHKYLYLCLTYSKLSITNE